MASQYLVVAAPELVNDHKADRDADVGGMLAQIDMVWGALPKSMAEAAPLART